MEKDYWPSIGNKITLKKMNAEDRRFYPSQVLDIIDEKIVISGPIHKNQIVLVSKGDILEIDYLIEKKGKYSFNAEVLTRELKKIYKLEIIKITDIRRQQLRLYYRFETDIPVIKEYEVRIGNKTEIIIECCRLKDISGGGLKLYSNQRHAIGDELLCRFSINEYKAIIKGMIMRVERIDTFEYNYALGVKFLEMDEGVRDKIVKYIFSKQRLLREKGLI